MTADSFERGKRIIRALLRGYRWTSPRLRKTIPRQSGDRRYRGWVRVRKNRR